jgi:hypothetical protein
VTTGLRELGPEDLQAALEQLLAPRLASLLATRGPGHCARIVDVETPLAIRLCERVRRSLHDDAQILVLGVPPQVPAAVAATSTKLVELRNPDEEGRLRPPLLVFVPPGTHASAEDSFGVATFEEVPLGDVYADLADQLLAGLPATVRRAVTEILAIAEEEKWPHATSYARARFLLTIAVNDNDPEVVGAAFFELGLVPDLELLADPAMVRTRTGLNIQQMEILTQPDRPDRQRVLSLGLTDRAFSAKFSAFATAARLDDPREWTRRIVIDRANWQFSFHRWPLRDARNVEAARIIVADLPLPQAGEDPQHASNPLLRNLAGQPFLVAGQQGPNQLPVTFEVRPDPRRIPGLARFTAQIVSEDSGPTGVVASVRPSAAGRSGHKATFRNLRRASLEPGWHFVRIFPVDDEGIPLPVEPSGSGTHPDNESEHFFIVGPAADDDDDLPSPERSTVHSGVTQALRAAQFQAQQDGRDWRTVQCQAVGWHGTGHHALRASFGPHGVADIPLSPLLTDIQRRTLADPGRPVRWQLRVDIGEMAVTSQQDEIDWSTASAGPVDAFLAARAAALDPIRADGLVVEGTDLQALRPVAQAYAEAYGELLAWQLQQAERSDETQRARVLADLTAMLQVDTVEAVVSAPDGTRRIVTLVGPTHPLRMLWLITWAELGRHWLDGSADTSRSAMTAAGRTLAALAPLGFPFVVLLTGGRLTMAAADLTTYWGACLPTDTPDPQALLARLARALRIPARQPGDRVVAPRALADRVERYLRQHPYVTTLVISAVNFGHADLLADMLVELQRRRHLKRMRYDLRVFAPGVAIAESGEALASLLRDEWTAAADAEAFHTRQASGLIPKLSVAVLPLADFRAITDARQSHLTFLFDAFSGETFDAAPAIVSPGTLPVHGLVQDVTVIYEENEGGAVWRKQPRHGRAAWIPGAEEACDLLASLPATISSAAAAVATGQVGVGLVPRITLSLTPADGALLHQAHRSSDWVITIDRTLGMEYFDTPSSARRPDYVIDFEGSSDGGLDHHLVISSRSIDELRALLAPAIGQHGLSVPPRHAGTFIEQLRLLSGRLAFKLASTTATQRTEVLGLALARLYLDYQGVLADQVLLPLDDHLELYRDARRTGQDISDSVSLKRTDLALWSLDAQRRLITCRLVEVKCYSSLPGAVGYEQLKERIAGQLRSSEEILAARFDPAHDLADRPDRTVRNAELGQLLRFYLGRAIRHGTMRPDAAREAEWLLGNLDRGKYQIRFTRTGLIFDMAGEGMSSEADGGVEYHRIGRNLIEELLEAIPTDAVLAAEVKAISTSPTMSTLDASLPRLAEAAFRAPDRDHETPDEPGPALPDLADDLGDGDADATREVPEAVAGDEDRIGGTPVSIGTDVVTPPASVEISIEDSSQGFATSAVPGAGSSVRVPDIFLGTSRPTPQYGILGQDAHFGRTVALDLNETHTISLFGVQGGGKSYTLGSIIEAATLPAPPVSQLPQALATIVFHYSPTLDYEPEFTSMIAPNTDSVEVEDLASRYGGTPGAIRDIVVLVPGDQLDQRRAEHPELTVLSLKFASRELRAEHWRFLMGAVGNQSTYIRQLQRIMKAHRNDLRLDVIRNGVIESGLTDALKQLAQQRLDLAEEYIDDSASIKDVVRPGRMIIVDLRDEFIEKDEALGLFVVLMQLFADAQRERFNKLVVFDEAHKYIDSPDLVDGLVSSVREMRHKGMSVLVASQDPPSVPIKLIELSDVVILHKFNSPAWLRHMQKATVSLAELTPARMSSLAPGEAYVWSSKATDQDFTRGAVRMKLRPRMTRHGGGTRTAVE